MLKGVARPELLATYDMERRPAAKFTVEQAYTRYVTRSATYLGAKDFQPLANDFDIELGYLYQSPAILAEENPIEGMKTRDSLSAGPGSRGPHLWLERHGQRVSTIDLFGRSFVLLTGPAGAAWAKAAPEATKSFNGLALSTHVVGSGDLSDPEHRFATSCGITDSGATLVRPDGFVAWRAKEMVSDPRGGLTRVLGKVLSG